MTTANKSLRTKSRHDHCVALRGVPIVEAIAAIVMADAKLRHRAQVG
ncbi:chorismate synthase [Brevundimonas terrae]